jgi:thiamine pyrophosphokinase
MSKFAILLGGRLTPTPRVAAQLRDARIIAADSGMKHASPLGLTPEVWIGDFDSADDLLKTSHAHVPRLQFPSAKDATDGALAVREAMKRGATEIVLAGAFGGQFDHALSHAVQLIGLAEVGIKAFATSGDEEAWPLLEHVSLWQMPKGTRISLIGLTGLKALSITGVRWPLHSRDLPMGSTLTLSNEAESDVSITLKQGRAIVLVYPKAKA